MLQHKIREAFADSICQSEGVSIFAHARFRLRAAGKRRSFLRPRSEPVDRAQPDVFRR